MSHYISNGLINNTFEYKLLEHDKRINLLEQTFNSFKEKNNHIFFLGGQIYDAYSLLIDILNKSIEEIIIIDKKELYHSGSSFKDLGKKCFAISKLEDSEYLNKIIKETKKSTC